MWAARTAALALLGLALGGCPGSCAGPPAPVAAPGPADARPKGPPPRLDIIDSHVHITPLPPAVRLALRIFDAAGVVKFAVKSAGSVGSPRYEATRRVAAVLGEKMAFFVNLDWEGIDAPGWGAREASRLRRAMREGASGVKIFKALGLGVRLADGSLLKVDDARLEPVWRAAAESGAIVAWHVADPVAFFEKPDEHNERYEELKMAPEWSFYGRDYPSHDALIAARDRVVAAHPRVTFLLIHFANWPENLDYIGRLLDRFPNVYVDTSARIGEIGRHPADRVRALFVRHRRRILFGSDIVVTTRGMQLGSVSPEPPTFADAVRFYAVHRRFFETGARQMDHPTPSQGRWKVDAIALPRPVLRDFYFRNADRLIFAPRRRWLAAHPPPIPRAAPGSAPGGASSPAKKSVR